MLIGAVRQTLRELADARAAVAGPSEQLAALRKAFDAEHAVLIGTVSLLREAAAGLEGEARALVEAYYHQTGDKTPCGKACQIKEFVTYDYAPERALVWAKEKGLCLIPEALDTKAFAKIAAATPLDFVAVVKEPRAEIAKQINPTDVAEPASESVPTPTEEQSP